MNDRSVPDAARERQRQDRRTALLRVSAFLASVVLVLLVWPRHTSSPPSVRDIVLVTADSVTPAARDSTGDLRVQVTEAVDRATDTQGWRALARDGYRLTTVSLGTDSGAEGAGEDVARYTIYEPNALLPTIERWLRDQDDTTPRRPLFLWLRLGEDGRASAALNRVFELWRKQRPAWEPVAGMLVRRQGATTLDLRLPQPQEWVAASTTVRASQVVPLLLSVAGAGADSQGLPVRRR